MKILVLSDDLDAVMRHTFALLAKRGHEVVIAGPNEQLGSAKIKSKLTFKAIKSLRQIIRGEKPDVVFCPSTSGLSNALLAARGFKVKIVGYRGTQARVSRWDPTNYLALLNPGVDAILCETEDIVDILAQAGIKREKLLWASKPYALEWAEPFCSSPKTVAEPQGWPRLIMIGHCQHRPHKGLHYLLEAMKLLPEASLTVIGRTDAGDRENAPGNVTFLGPDAQAPHYLPSHDLLMLPSTRDASPRTVREAQACGVPCIVSDIPGARDLIIPGITGLLVPPGNPEAIAQAVKSLDRDKIKKMGVAAKEHIRDHFSVSYYVDKVEQCLSM